MVNFYVQLTDNTMKVVGMRHVVLNSSRLVTAPDTFRNQRASE